MRSQLAGLFATVALAASAVAQTAPSTPPTLRRNAFFKPAEGAAELARIEATYGDLAGWQRRAAMIRQGLRDGMDLQRTPTLAPLVPIRHSRRALDGYSVESVAFESLPGIWVTGNLYEPLDAKPGERRPAVLNTHGHSTKFDSRFQEQLQNRSATLARMGATVLAIDMIGYGDMTQCTHRLPIAMKLQMINAQRAIDFLISLPDVDAERIAVTGESGGATEAFLLGAMDERVKVVVPVAMVSCYFYGGCPCEQGMPIHVRPTYTTCNAEIAATIAPRPMLLISDGGDWSNITPHVEFPYLQRVYALFGKTMDVENAHLPNDTHNYGINKRLAAYAFLAKRLGLDLSRVTKDGQVDETRNTILTPTDLSVFNAEHPRPPNAIVGDDAVIALVTNAR